MSKYNIIRSIVTRFMNSKMQTLYLVILIVAKVTTTPIGFAKPIEPNLGQFPFHASLLQKGQSSYFSFCGGSLIHPFWVLTAAHCIQLDEKSTKMQPNEILIALGSIYRSASRAQIITADKLIIHENYPTSGRHDIGLVKLKTAAKLNQNVNLIQLHIDNTESLLNQTAYLTGFGIINDFYQTPRRLRQAILHISSYNKCFGEAQFKGTELCAASRISEGKACKGDSGGPLFITRKNRYIQIGITSHLAILPICRVFFNNSVYTRISAYIAWITKKTNINFSQ